MKHPSLELHGVDPGTARPPCNTTGHRQVAAQTSAICRRRNAEVTDVNNTVVMVFEFAVKGQGF